MLSTDSPEPSAVKTTKLANFWLKNSAKNMDKVYRLELQSVDSVNGVRRFAVFGMYGRRGKGLTMHIIRDNATLDLAYLAFHTKWKELLVKGYSEVNEDLVNGSPLSTSELTFKALGF
jgi:hypothetical protein